MLDFLARLDKRWIFLLVLLAVTLPILIQLKFPEEISPMVHNVYKAIEDLPDGSDIWMAYDYDPGSQGELQPMGAAFTRHCAKKKHKLYYMTLWPQGGPMIQRCIDILNREFPDYEYGRDYVNLGYRPGNEGVIKVVVNDLQELFGNDVNGTSLDQIPLTKSMKNIQHVDLLVNVSAGDPGTKQWVQFASTPFGIRTVSGSTGVQAPALYPYIPEQLIGVLGAIKAAAEYEQALLKRYPDLVSNKNAQEGLRRMGPQLVAHLLMIVLIIIGNVIFFASKRRGAQS